MNSSAAPTLWEEICRTIKPKVGETAFEAWLKPISAKISCGTLNAINDEALRFAFEAIAKGTICEGIKLEIEHKVIRGWCRNCNENFDVVLPEARCPKCGGEEFDLLADAPLLLEEIEFEME